MKPRSLLDGNLNATSRGRTLELETARILVSHPPPPKTLIAASVERVILGSTKGKTSLRIAQAPWLQHGQERVAQNANQ